MRIRLSSIVVDDQDKALRFYTEILGFQKKHEIPMGPYKWLTVISPDGPNEVELSIEPNANPAAKTYQEAMFAQKIPLAAFETSDIDADYKRLSSLGVVFLSEPKQAGPVKIATFSDTCGNVIQLYQPPS
jgi:catechol 2,3-dioxygenase-like lactoylglutathione lyase family enzyme